MYFEVEPLLIQNLVFDYASKNIYYDKSLLNRTHGAVVSKDRTLNASALGQNLRTSLLNETMSRKSSQHRDSNPRRDSNPK